MIVVLLCCSCKLMLQYPLQANASLIGIADYGIAILLQLLFGVFYVYVFVFKKINVKREDRRPRSTENVPTII